LLKIHSSQPQADLAVLLDALALSWFIGGTDAHAKNDSLLHAPNHQLRLAPLYDLASILPYEAELHRVRLAMKIGGEVELRKIRGRHWAAMGPLLGMGEAAMLSQLQKLGGQVLERLPVLCAEIRPQNEFVMHFEQRILAHTRSCLEKL
jgi:serine/threonine-protein kinase HipA